ERRGERRQPRATGAGSTSWAGFPPTPARRDRCGIPVVTALEDLMRPAGIRLVQRRLVEESLLADGRYRVGRLDEATLGAVLAFQERADLPAVGLPTYATVEALGLDLDAVFLTGRGADCQREAG